MTAFRRHRFILIDEERKQNCLRYIATLPSDANPPYEIAINVYRKNRSIEQNSRLWWMYTFIAQEAYRLGISDKYYEPECYHEYFKRRFLGKRVVIDGSIHLIPESSANKNVVEFQEFMQNIEVWAAEHGIVIPALPFDGTDYGIR